MSSDVLNPNVLLWAGGAVAPLLLQSAACRSEREEKEQDDHSSTALGALERATQELHVYGSVVEQLNFSCSLANPNANPKGSQTVECVWLSVFPHQLTLPSV